MPDFVPFGEVAAAEEEDPLYVHWRTARKWHDIALAQLKMPEDPILIFAAE